MGPASIHLGDFGGGGPIGLHAGAGGMMGIGLGGTMYYILLITSSN